MIQARSIYKHFRGLDVLNGADLDAADGHITLLTGANGSGKSTLLKILTGLMPPDSGTPLIAGFNIAKARRAAQRQLSFLPQNINFHPAATPMRILDFYGRLRGADTSRASSLLDEFGLSDAASRPTAKLSGGMLQRLGLALALLPDADNLILDEPGSGLDPEWRIVLREKMIAEARRGKTILLTSHLAEEWDGAADAIYDCREGRIYPSSISPAKRSSHS